MPHLFSTHQEGITTNTLANTSKVPMLTKDPFEPRAWTVRLDVVGKKTLLQQDLRPVRAPIVSTALWYISSVWPQIGAHTPKIL